MSLPALRASIDIFLSPTEVFDRVKLKNHWWLAPFVLVLTAVPVMFLYYFASVDFAWLQDIMIDAMAAERGF